jgi:hypothetical protein
MWNLGSYQVIKANGLYPSDFTQLYNFQKEGSLTLKVEECFVDSVNLTFVK